jgi:hypothetical protein
MKTAVSRAWAYVTFAKPKAPLLLLLLLLLYCCTAPFLRGMLGQQH